MEYPNKSIYAGERTFRCGWILSLAFEGGQVLNFGGDFETYPDTYVDFGKELINLFGIDLLDVEEISEINVLKS